jgi:molybdopterin synthase sulfur carrier subunit
MASASSARRSAFTPDTVCHVDGNGVDNGVRVRLFAALREAAGEAECRLEPATVADLLERLCARYGEIFAARLAIATVLVDGRAVRQGADLEVPGGAELALLPPVSGGADGAP